MNREVGLDADREDDCAFPGCGRRSTSLFCPCHQRALAQLGDGSVGDNDRDGNEPEAERPRRASGPGERSACFHDYSADPVSATRRRVVRPLMDRDTALAVLSRCTSALGTRLDAGERERVRDLYQRALSALTPSSARRAQDVALLERELRDYPPGERAAAIMSRLKIPRSTFYRIRRSIRESHRNETEK
jgi:hypothetical protein